MTYVVVEVLRQEHRNIEKLLCVFERELCVFDRGDRPNYEVVLGVIDYFKDYPDSCHHPKEDIIFEKLKSRDPVAAANIGDLRAEHEGAAKRLQRVAQTVERVRRPRRRRAIHPLCVAVDTSSVAAMIATKKSAATRRTQRLKNHL